MTEVKQSRIWKFNEKHGVTEDQQFKALVEELGELAEVLNRDADDEAVAEELADVIFVARSLAELRDIDITATVNEVAAENLEKDTETDGQMVTKSGAAKGDSERLITARQVISSD